uniref:Immunoglobulin V-set domain-containing protein n=1 Tax=Acanthochromis polyacanthus TaxID=80966 RepID=A0A3Q1GBX0_9TELE
MTSVFAWTKVLSFLIMILFVSSTAQHMELITADINVYSYNEGRNVSIKCTLNSFGVWKFFCRRECKGEDILVKTDEDTSQNGRYSVKYKQGSSKREFVTVKITQLIKSDSGQYRCGLGGPLVPERYRDFYINVTDGEFLLIYFQFNFIFIVPITIQTVSRCFTSKPPRAALRHQWQDKNSLFCVISRSGNLEVKSTPRTLCHVPQNIS